MPNEAKKQAPAETPAGAGVGVREPRVREPSCDSQVSYLLSWILRLEGE